MIFPQTAQGTTDASHALPPVRLALTSTNPSPPAAAQEFSSPPANLPMNDKGKCVTGGRIAEVSCGRGLARKDSSFGPGAGSSLLFGDLATEDSSFPLFPARDGERGPRFGMPGVRGGLGSLAALCRGGALRPSSHPEEPQVRKDLLVRPPAAPAPCRGGPSGRFRFALIPGRDSADSRYGKVCHRVPATGREEGPHQ